MKLFYSSFVTCALIFSCAASEQQADLPVMHDAAEGIRWALRPGMISYHHKNYARKRSQDLLIKRAAQVTTWAICSYAVYWAGKGIFNWYRNRADVPGGLNADNLPILNAARELPLMRREINELKDKVDEKFFVGWLRLMGTLIAQSIILEQVQKIVKFASQELFQTYFMQLKSQRESAFEFLDYSIDQMAQFQTQDPDVFRYHRDVLMNQCGQLLVPFCEEYIGAYQAFVSHVPQQALAYKLTNTPMYLHSLVNKGLESIKASLTILQTDESNVHAIADLKKHVHLLRDEINNTLSRAILVIERELA